MHQLKRYSPTFRPNKLLIAKVKGKEKQGWVDGSTFNVGNKLQLWSFANHTKFPPLFLLLHRLKLLKE